MSVKLPRYLVARPKYKHGKKKGFYYWWQPKTSLKAHGFKDKKLGTDLVKAIELAEHYNAALDAWRKGETSSITNQEPGTLNQLFAKYLNSSDFAELAQRTKRDYRSLITQLSDWGGDIPLDAITTGTIVTFYESIWNTGKRTTANKLIRVLRLVMAHGKRIDFIQYNPATGIRLKNPGRKIPPLWSKEAVFAFVKKADDMGHYSLGTAVMLNEWIGMRRVDLCSLKRGIYNDGCLVFIQSKTANRTGGKVIIPIDIVPHLKNRIESQLQYLDSMNLSHDYLFVTAEGASFNNGEWSQDHFTRLIKQVRDKACKDEPTLLEVQFKHLRNTAITRMAEVGVSTPQIASISGHSIKYCEQIIDLYNIRTKKMAEEAFKTRLKSLEI